MSDGAAPSPSGREARQTAPGSAAGPASSPARSSSSLRNLLGRFRPAREKGLNGVLQEGSGATLTPAEREMIERIVAFDTKRVDDVAIPRADIIGVDHDVTLAELLTTFSEAGHSRLPVYRDDLDDPIGMVHIKDLVGMLAEPDRAEGGDTPILKGLTRKILYVPPSMPITDLFLRMQASRIHMALVIDEFGGTDGLVTIEDLIEEIVGDIRDEHDNAEEFGLRKTKNGRWDADARLPLEEFEEKTGLDLRLPDDEADTVGGLVFALAGRIPVRGEVIPHPDGAEFEVAEADARRIRRVLVRPLAAETVRREPLPPPAEKTVRHEEAMRTAEAAAT
ncbi:hemolysin family protein [Parvularcula oceani]|uniref:hemolysin family protein n=1 Tax=Parvularcula oceani TaxID=1247963 RepID=UPI00068FB414|nr:hemolysin family protein [Parvularcula oceani]